MLGCQRHAVFPSGHPSKYWPHPMLLDFGVRKGTGRSRAVWSLATTHAFPWATRHPAYHWGNVQVSAGDQGALLVKDHTALDLPVPFRTPQSSRAGCGQYQDGRPLGNTACPWQLALLAYSLTGSLILWYLLLKVPWEVLSRALLHLSSCDR